MSFYGDIKRINSSPYIFDKYYPNRAIMDNNASTDNIYVGRYVLVKYTCEYIDNKNGLIYFNKKIGRFEEVNDLTAETYEPNYYYFKNNNEEYKLATGDFVNGRNYYKVITWITDAYAENVSVDINKYKDTFDATVWQKIYSLGEEKYILVAELNAAVPRLELDVTAPKYFADNKEQWYEPKILEEASSEDAYTFQIPDALHLDVGTIDDDFYAKDLTNPAKRERMRTDGTSTNKDPKELDAILIEPEESLYSSKYNYAEWKNYLNGQPKEIPGENGNPPTPITTGDIDEKRLEMKMYAFGKAVSDIYDALYGIPATQDKIGARPFYADNLSDVLSNYNKGLIGILSSIATDAKGDGTQDSYGRTLNPGLHYYFNAKWNSVNEDPDNFIENIPEVIGSINEQNNGKANYYIQNWQLLPLLNAE